jgi:hypothetical protein
MRLGRFPGRVRLPARLLFQVSCHPLPGLPAPREPLPRRLALSFRSLSIQYRMPCEAYHGARPAPLPTRPPQTPPDLVVKFQPIDIVGFIL